MLTNDLLSFYQAGWNSFGVPVLNGRPAGALFAIILIAIFIIARPRADRPANTRSRFLVLVAAVFICHLAIQTVAETSLLRLARSSLLFHTRDKISASLLGDPFLFGQSVKAHIRGPASGLLVSDLDPNTTNEIFIIKYLLYPQLNLYVPPSAEPDVILAYKLNDRGRIPGRYQPVFALNANTFMVVKHAHH